MIDEQRDLMVVCPVYNDSASALFALAEEWEKALDARGASWEWVFIDDGSTAPGTRQALREIAADRPRFKVWRTPNQGRDRAALFGREMVRGLTRRVLQVDSDSPPAREAYSASRR